MMNGLKSDMLGIVEAESYVCFVCIYIGILKGKKVSPKDKRR